MTNTHINVGGHKITTNKVGTVHSVSQSSLTSNFTILGNVRYCVTNGVCHVSIWSITPSTTGTNQRVTPDGTFPKAKFISGASTGYTGHVNICWIDTYGALWADVYSSGTGMYVMLSYPVADDWVES